MKLSSPELIELVKELSDNYTQDIPENVLKAYPQLDLGNNGRGDRWCRSLFNFSIIYKNRKIMTKSDDETDKYLYVCNEHHTRSIFIHSLKSSPKNSRHIPAYIKKYYKKLPCVVCGSEHTECDHKNDNYNSLKLDITDFQPLCKHCNGRKRQVSIQERNTEKLYSAKNIPQFSIYAFTFPWEFMQYDPKSPTNKDETYWFDPVEFNRKIIIQLMFQPILSQLRSRAHT